MSESPSAPHPADSRPCLLCGDVDNPTVEHVIPQALWNRFGIDPNESHLAPFRTNLCGRHNHATSALHRRSEVINLIAEGEPASTRALTHLADWAVWVTLLLGLARGSGVLDADKARELLLRRFDSHDGGLPKGVRVYVAPISEHVEASETDGTQYALALVGDSRVVTDAEGRPQGLSERTGSTNASEAIALGKLAILVVGKSYKSGPAHEERLNEAARSVGMECIWPLSDRVATLDPRRVSIAEVGRLFTADPFGADLSLFPASIRGWIRLMEDGPSELPSACSPDQITRPTVGFHHCPPDRGPRRSS